MALTGDTMKILGLLALLGLLAIHFAGDLSAPAPSALGQLKQLAWLLGAGTVVSGIALTALALRASRIRN